MLIAAGPVDQPLQLFILLILGHFLADFPLQNDRMAVEKCPGKDVVLNWRWWLSAHAATHGFVVAMLTGWPVLGVAEMLTHGLIDYGKCRLHYSLAVDQALHWLCKAVWVLVLMAQA
ncbi:MAG: DUF3307 domain-containing protein [Synechococcus sp.]